MPTTVTSTIGAGGDYSTVQAWEDAAPADLVAADQVWEGQCFNQEFTGGPVVAIAGSTTDATRYKHLTAAPGASFMDNANVRTNALRYNASNGAALNNTSGGYAAAIRVQEGHFKVTRLQLMSLREAINHDSGVGYINIENCICASSNISNPILNLSRGNSRVVNTLVHRTSGTASHTIIQGFGRLTFINLTLANASNASPGAFGIAQSYPSSCVMTNVAVFGCTTAISSVASTTSTNCFTSQASPPSGWTQVAYDTTTGSGFEGTTSSAPDYRIKSTSALRDAGATDAANAPADITGLARPQGASYDVGAWEFGAAAVLSRLPRKGGPSFTNLFSM